MSSHEPGLIKREVVARGISGVEIYETWDTRVPGCPFALMGWRDERTWLVEIHYNPAAYGADLPGLPLPSEKAT